MKAASTGNFNKGFSTVEIMIALAILTLTISAVIIVVFGNQSLALDTQTNVEALAKAQSQLEEARALAAESFSLVPYAATVTDGIYEKTLSSEDRTQCQKQATSTVVWTTQGRTHYVELTTLFTDPLTALAMGGDCESVAADGWRKPKLYASYKFNPGQPTALDVLRRVAYMPDDKGTLNIVDTTGATLGYSGNFVGSLDLGEVVNAIDVARSKNDTRTIAYAAQNDTEKQVAIIDVTTPGSPVALASVPLRGVDPLNAFAQGWRIAYYDNYAFVGTRYVNGGPEFHILNVSDPAHPLEIGDGIVVNTSIYGIAIREEFVSGAARRLAYLVTSHDAREVVVLDVTDPTNVTFLSGASTNLPGSKDGRSLALVGSRLYVGLESGSGEEFYVIDVSKTVTRTAGMPILGKTELGSGATVNGIRVSGMLAFLATAKSNDEFQVWNVRNPSNIVRQDTTPIGLPNKIVGGIDFEYPYIYVGSQATNPLQILYSAP